MKAVYSFYTKPYLSKDSIGWLTDEAMFQSFVLSLFLTKRHGYKVQLVTDYIGKYLLIDVLKLPFDEVSTAIEQIKDDYPVKLWIAGKVKAYEIQEKPFVHIDSDVFLWQDFKPRLKQSAIFTQEIELLNFQDIQCFKAMDNIKKLAKYVSDAIKWTYVNGNKKVSCNVGVLAINDMVLKNYYVDEMLKFMDTSNPYNKVFWELYKGQENKLCTTIEQYLLMCICQYKKTDMKFMFEDYKDVTLFDNEYTHLVSTAKHNPKKILQLKSIVENRLPQFKDRIAVCVKEFKNIRLNGNN